MTLRDRALLRAAAVLLVPILLALTACGGTSSTQDQTQIPTPQPQPQPEPPPAPEPLVTAAKAGPDTRVFEESVATLNGALSTAAEGLSLVGYRWTQLSGEPFELRNADTAVAEFDTPELFKAISAEFLLTITDSDGVTDTDTVNVRIDPNPGDANRFFTFVNHAAAVPPRPSGIRFVAATFDEGAAGAYTLTVTVGDEEPIVFEGSWTDSGGQDPFDTTGNRVHLIQPTVEGTIIARLESEDTDAVLYAVMPDPTDCPAPGQCELVVVAQNDDSEPGTTDSEVQIGFSAKDSLAVAQAYYEAIDPDDENTTLEDWKDNVGFDNGTQANAVYLNGADLGFARNMSFRRNFNGRSASYVENYETIEDAINRTNILATVAMEHSPPEGGGDNITKFYVFGANGQRLEGIDLDGRGVKFVPILCNICHGGQTPRLEPDGSFPNGGDIAAQFLPWDLNTFVFSDDPDYVREVQEDDLKALNEFTLATWPENPGDFVDGLWTGETARDLAEGWYGSPGLPSDTFDGNFAPPGWRPPQAPADAERLYHEIVAPFCRACHITRGTTRQSDIDFGSFAQFIAYAPQIERLVFDEGAMPDSKLTFELFWADEHRESVELLADMLPGFSARDAQGNLLRPGRPVARPGPNRISEFHAVGTGDFTLDGRGSLYATQFSWRMLSREGNPATMGAFTIETASPDATPEMPLFRFTGGDNGCPCWVELTVSNDAGDTDTGTILVKPNPALTPMTWADDIHPMLETDCAAACHGPGGIGTHALVIDGSAADFGRIEDRLSYLDPLNSKLVQKASGHHHGGGTRPGWNLEGASDPAASDADQADAASLSKLLNYMTTIVEAP